MLLNISQVKDPKKKLKKFEVLPMKNKEFSVVYWNHSPLKYVLPVARSKTR